MQNVRKIFNNLPLTLLIFCFIAFLEIFNDKENIADIYKKKKKLWQITWFHLCYSI
jgi:hypothetical protein